MKPDTDKRRLQDATLEEKMTPPELQVNPSAQQATDPERINPEIDTPAAEGSIPESRAPENEGELTEPQARTTDTAEDDDEDELA